MLKKLTDEQKAEILEIGISEFARYGRDKANINTIAKKANVSVGVVYKYFENKEGLFQACLRQALGALEAVIEDVLKGEEKILVRVEKLIRALLWSARNQPDYNVLYHEITAGSTKQYAPILAKEIESISSKAYASFIKQAQMEGDIRKDIDPSLFAFFFDSLLMMLQFSYCSDYHRERFKIYCGEAVFNDDERVIRELLKFFESAFTTEQSEIIHRK